MIIWSILCLLLLLIGWLFFTPLVLRLDTEQGVYEMRWAGMRVRPILDDQGPGLRFTAPFIWKEVRFTAGPASKTPVAPRPNVRPTVHRSRFGSSHARRIAPRLIRSFRVRRFRMVLDTDDVLWNAWLFPVFHMLRVSGHDVRISFTGHSTLQLTLENNLFRLLRAVLSKTNQHTTP